IEHPQSSPWARAIESATKRTPSHSTVDSAFGFLSSPSPVVGPRTPSHSTVDSAFGFLSSPSPVRTPSHSTVDSAFGFLSSPSLVVGPVLFFNAPSSIVLVDKSG
ncbi:dedicator of cytokinesis protein 4, partial [Striga asiatica]